MIKALAEITPQIIHELRDTPVQVLALIFAIGVLFVAYLALKELSAWARWAVTELSSSWRGLTKAIESNQEANIKHAEADEKRSEAHIAVLRDIKTSTDLHGEIGRTTHSTVLETNAKIDRLPDVIKGELAPLVAQLKNIEDGVIQANDTLKDLRNESAEVLKKISQLIDVTATPSEENHAA